MREHSDAASRNSDTQCIDYRVVTRTGETRWINHMCKPVYDPANLRMGRVVSNRDITARKRMGRGTGKTPDSVSAGPEDGVGGASGRRGGP